MPKKQTKTKDLPQIPESGLELYDEIMTKIEPDLVSSALPDLAARFSEGDDAATKARAQKYVAAFRTFQAELAAKNNQMKQEVHDFIDESVAIAEAFSAEMEEESMQSIEDQISNLPE